MQRIELECCEASGFEPRARRVVQAVHEALGRRVTLVAGRPAVFALRVDGRTVARKDRDRGFPTEAECVAGVRAALKTGH